MMERGRAEDAAKWGWALLIWGAPWSHAAMTAGTVWVTGCALIALKQRGVQGLSSAPLLWLLGLFAWGWLSLLWSDNMEWGLQLASIQATMVALALAWHVVPRPDLTTKWVFQSAAFAMAGTLAWGAWRVGQGEVLAARDWTPWTSHIRLAMLAALGWVWGAQQQTKTSLLLYGALWALFTAVTGSLTSALLWPLALLWLVLGHVTPSARRGLLAASAGATLALAVGLGAWLRPVPLPQAELPAFTAQGHAYIHHPERVVSEGGHRLHLFLCPQEWEDAWSQISDTPLNQANAAGFTVRDRLPRYLTSLGLPKDGEHILQLTPQDVRAIEGGATHAIPAKGLRLRFRELRREWEVWQDGGNPSGHALFQRFAHWRAGWRAWMHSFWVGHGMGDTSSAMERAYAELGSELAAPHRHRAHMQHLTWGISGGFIAVLLWLGFARAWHQGIGRHNRLALWGGLMLLLSCVFEDAWETQAGVVISFLALFGAFHSPAQAD